MVRDSITPNFQFRIQYTVLFQQIDEWNNFYTDGSIIAESSWCCLLLREREISTLHIIGCPCHITVFLAKIYAIIMCVNNLQELFSIKPHSTLYTFTCSDNPSIVDLGSLVECLTGYRKVKKHPFKIEVADNPIFNTFTEDEEDSHHFQICCPTSVGFDKRRSTHPNLHFSFDYKKNISLLYPLFLISGFSSYNIHCFGFKTTTLTMI